MVVVTDADRCSSNPWGVNASNKLPISHGSSFGAYFDEDKMAFLCFKYNHSIDGCSRFIWNTEDE